MNWFKRNGIVGTYFLLVMSAWFYILTDAFNKIPIDSEQVGTLYLFSFLAIGYVINQISQLIYYKWPRGGIHSRVANLLPDSQKQKLGLNNGEKEATLETKMTIFTRLNICKKEEIDCIKYMAEFARKRWDVIAMNNSIILSNYLSMIFVLIFCSLGIESITFGIRKPRLLVAFIGFFIVIIPWLLFQLNKILRKQIVESAKNIIIRDFRDGPESASP